MTKKDYLQILMVTTVLGLLLGFCNVVWSQVIISPPEEQVEIGRHYLLEVTGLQPADLPQTELKSEPVESTNAIGVTGWAGQQFIWFRSTEPGRVMVVVGVGRGEGQKPEISTLSFIVGKEDEQPDPQPDPEPGPDPTPGPRKVVVILERSNPITSPKMAATLFNLRLWMKDQGYTWENFLIVDKDSKEGPNKIPTRWLQPYLREIEKRRLNVPVLVVDAEPIGVLGSEDGIETMPEDAQMAIEIVKKYGGGKTNAN